MPPNGMGAKAAGMEQGHETSKVRDLRFLSEQTASLELKNNPNFHLDEQVRFNYFKTILGRSVNFVKVNQHQSVWTVWSRLKTNTNDDVTSGSRGCDVLLCTHFYLCNKNVSHSIWQQLVLFVLTCLKDQMGNVIRRTHASPSVSGNL